jgi:hypothetical protein
LAKQSKKYADGILTNATPYLVFRAASRRLKKRVHAQKTYANVMSVEEKP